MNVGRFYSIKTSVIQVTWLQDAIETAEETKADNITILLPGTGGLDIPSCEEIGLTNIISDIQETAGLLEIEISEDEESDAEAPPTKV